MNLFQSNNYDDYRIKQHAFDDNGQLTHVELSNRHGSLILTRDGLCDLFGSDPLSMEEMARRIDRAIGGDL
jgi:hypothetical protein